MASIVTLAFVDGDFVVSVSPSSDPISGLTHYTGALVEVTDNEALIQNGSLSMQLQLGMNQYFEEAGWDWMNWVKAPIDQDGVDTICKQVAALMESMDFVLRATCTYLGVDAGTEEHSFEVSVTSAFGSFSIPYALPSTGAF